MTKYCIYFLVIILLINLIFICKTVHGMESNISSELDNENNNMRVLSRQRRYLVFPSGTSVQLAYCFTTPSVGLGEIFTLGIIVAVAWELPDKPDELFVTEKKEMDMEDMTTTMMPTDHDVEPMTPDHHPSERIDKLPTYTSAQWTVQSGKYPGAVTNLKTYYNPFLVDKTSIYGYRPVDAFSKQTVYGKRNSSILNYLPYSRPPSGSGRNRNRYKYSQQKIRRPVDPLTRHPSYFNYHRRSRRELYKKIETFLTALSKDGKTCVKKAICEVSQAIQRKGTLMEELLKAVFRVKPHEEYPDEDEFDLAANKGHNCTKQYPTCDSSIWSNMFSK